MTNCPQHGSYKAKTLTILGTEIKKGCPICQEEREAREKIENQNELIAREHFMAQVLIQNSDIPKRYLNAKLETLGDKARKPFNYDRNLILTGSTGAGKTYYACALGLEAIKLKKTVRYVLCSEIDAKIKETWSDKNKSEARIIESLSNCDLLILDEVGRGVFTDYHFRILDGRYNRGLFTIFIGNLSVDELKAFLGDAIISRIRGLKVRALDFGKTDLRAQE